MLSPRSLDVTFRVIRSDAILLRLTYDTFFFYAARASLMNSYKIRTLFPLRDPTRVRIRYFLLSGSIFTVTLPLKAVSFTPARSIDDAKPIDDPRNRIFLSRLVRS